MQCKQQTRKQLRQGSVTSKTQSASRIGPPPRPPPVFYRIPNMAGMAAMAQDAVNQMNRTGRVRTMRFMPQRILPGYTGLTEGGLVSPVGGTLAVPPDVSKLAEHPCGASAPGGLQQPCNRVVAEPDQYSVYAEEANDLVPEEIINPSEPDKLPPNIIFITIAGFFQECLQILEEPPRQIEQRRTAHEGDYD
jgi:hypothetical protein